MPTSKNLLKFLQNPYKYIRANPSSNLKYLLIPISWTFQGLLYSDKTEKAYKIILDFLMTLVLYSILNYLMNSTFNILYAFITAHTLNWFLNSGFWGPFRGKYGMFIPNIVVPYNMVQIRGLQTRISNKKSIQCAAIYGSISRNENGNLSDLDVRIIRYPGTLNGFKACTFGFFERSNAFFKRLPLDLFILDSTVPLSKLRGDEIPLILHDPDGILKERYKTTVIYI